ncbi:hypothetical protein BpHYR1_019109 [Brachionus plicatilis]|uniref:Uncharacterized protein n=1 Tax=Brachionus plicatilis TaxID=10195 RepID=A0A3M7SD28_BRAPC|nr:hypothetical protein BpHYR1_019109 [Brachionus plicatilis]
MRYRRTRIFGSVKFMFVSSLSIKNISMQQIVYTYLLIQSAKRLLMHSLDASLIGEIYNFIWSVTEVFYRFIKITTKAISFVRLCYKLISIGFERSIDLLEIENYFYTGVNHDFFLISNFFQDE